MTALIVSWVVAHGSIIVVAVAKRILSEVGGIR